MSDGQDHMKPGVKAQDMTLRDHFAGLAMKVLMSEWGCWKPWPENHKRTGRPGPADAKERWSEDVTLASMGDEDIGCLTRYSYEFADAMLKAREQ